MGTTTNRGLRYPEPTVLANTLHTQIKNLADDVDSKFQFPCARYQMRSIGENTPSGSWYAVIYWVPIETDAKITWSGTSTFNVVDAGTYSITASAMFQNQVSSVGARGIQIEVNGTNVTGHYAAPIAGQGDYASASCSINIKLPANAGIRLLTLQNSGGVVVLNGGHWTNISIARIN